jgi:ADP-ribose pyrophosphatase YjhB (NUDIX family)
MMIVRDDKGRILLIRNADFNSWTPPGGSIEPDEPPEEAAIREMREETGLLVEPVRIIGVYGGPEYRFVYPNGDIASYVATVFECKVVSGEMAPDYEESLDVRYFSEAELDSIHTLPADRIVLRDAFNEVRSGDASTGTPNRDADSQRLQSRAKKCETPAGGE